ncbi:hypothetical protein ACIRN5_23330, partial [Lysinibacillus fusiformis]|uniref:hypothetical protein n=1 Tax=Lysinibacillus fusiformis TaxID=28031 RepID=UPI00380F17D6
MACNDEEDRVSTETENVPPYLRDLPHGRFHDHEELAKHINEGTVVSTLPYRGEVTQVVTTRPDPYGRRLVFGVIRETWFGDQASQWVRFLTVEAAQQWQQDTVAYWLRRHGGEYSPSQHFTCWSSQDGSWAVEIDRHRQRYITVLGTRPTGQRTECFSATRSLQSEVQVEEDEAHRIFEEHGLTHFREVLEERGWARLVEVLPVGPEEWPPSMKT